MKIDLFQRIDNRTKGLIASEKVALLYNILTALIICVLFCQLESPWKMLLNRVWMLAGGAVLYALYNYWPCKATMALRAIFPLALLPYWYPETYDYNRLFDNLDHIFASLEQSAFGCQPAILLSQYLPQSAWISEPMYFGYFSYFPMIAVVVFWTLFCKFEQFERTTFVIQSSFLLYYTIYIFLPVVGPQFYFPAIGWEQAAQGVFPDMGHYFSSHAELLPGPGYDKGLFYSLVEYSHHAGERPTAAFPSSHVGVSSILMYLAWRSSRKVFFCLLPVYVLLCISTVYIQAHYLIDVFAGFITAAMLYRMISLAYHKWFAH